MKTRWWHVPRFGGWVDLGLFLAGTMLVVAFVQITTPNFGKATYQFGDLPEQTTDLPVLVKTAAPTMKVRVPVTISRVSPNRFLVKPDDCIEEMKINNAIVPSAIAKFCDYDEGRVLDLGAYMRPGANVMHFTIRDDGGLGGVNVRVSSNDPLHIAAFTMFVVLFLWYAVTLIGHLRVPTERRLLAAAFVVGVTLRVLYVLSTPFRVRSYDVGGHLEYIDYVLQHWAIPLANNGWEYHQPPLYYWLSAVWIEMNRWVGRPIEMVYGDIQLASLILSAVALLACVWMARLLFPDTEKRKGGDVLFLLLVGALPAMVMFASRITNESLYQPLIFVGFAFLLSWWKNGRMRDWYIALVVIILASLSKISAAALFPVGLVCFLVWKRMGWKKKLVHVCAASVIIAVLFAWYPAKRFMEQRLDNVVTLGNKNMNGDLSIAPRGPSHYLTFNPVEIARLPFNDTWTDKYRRMYFWEFFYKSSFFGEFRFERLSQLATVMVSLGMVLLPFMLLGFAATLRGRKNIYDSLPLTLTTGILMAAALAYPTLFAYAPNQDFRFSVLLAVPFCYYVVRGIRAMPVLLRQILLGTLFAFILTCGLFFLAVYLRLHSPLGGT